MPDDPFGIVYTHHADGSREQHQTADSAPTYDDDGPGEVRVPCVCGAMLTRRRIPPHDWVHEDDETIIRGDTVISASKYDHLPVLDVIDM